MVLMQGKEVAGFDKTEYEVGACWGQRARYSGQWRYFKAKIKENEESECVHKNMIYTSTRAKKGLYAKLRSAVDHQLGTDFTPVNDACSSAIY